MHEKTLTITHPVGLHARPAKEFYKLARTFKSSITIQNLSRPETGEVAVSPFNLLQLGVRNGHEIRLRATGDDEAEAIAALEALIHNGFGDPPAEVS